MRFSVFMTVCVVSSKGLSSTERMFVNTTLVHSYPFTASYIRVHVSMFSHLLLQNISPPLLLSSFSRNALDTLHKMRRHLSGEPRSSTNSVRKVKNHPTYSSSQLSIKVSDLHADKYGRLEITCLSTIPAKVGGDDLFADFKSYSVKSK
jgi:hypothetical protein